MEYHLPLDKMTTNEKLQIMESLWRDLSRDSESLPVPAWHRDVLLAREMKVSDGTAAYMDWEQAKDLIRKNME